MTERPILFSGPMIRAILSGQKTQTRRVVKRQFAADADVAEVANSTPEGWLTSGHSGLWWDDAASDIDSAIQCRYGVPGDRLWVRECWAAVHYEDDTCWGSIGIPHKDDASLWDLQYRATHPLAHYHKSDRGWSWKPAIHMPRWASRITLEITSVRVERLQAISEADAMAEGAEPILVPPDGGSAPHVEGFRELWSSINGAESWDANPFVWVVEFAPPSADKGGAKP